MEERKFHKTVITVSVISEEPLGPMDLDAPSIVRGRPTVFEVKKETSEVDGREAAMSLYQAGSYPGYFRLDDDGNYHADKDVPEDWPEQCLDSLEDPGAPYLIRIDGVMHSYPTEAEALRAAGHTGEYVQRHRSLEESGTFLQLGRYAN
jgi:hypothetical protein